jgi:16S rRNA (guanine527-N7)-methyltransferase
MDLAKRLPLILELGFRKEAVPLLNGYLDLLWRANEELNLVSRKMTEDELIDNHVIDCLLPLKYFPKNLDQVADFGSGGGLPGVLYAIQWPQIQFQLFEKSPLKQNFLNRCKTFAPNLNVQGNIPLALEKVDLVIARAFKPLDVLLDVSRHYYKNGGKYFLLKARREKIDEEIVLAQKSFKDLEVQIETLKSPILEVERHLVLIH